MRVAIVRIVLATALALCGSFLSASRAQAGEQDYLYRIEGISYAADANLDVLKVGVPEGITPDFHRYGMPNRIVISFPGAVLGGTLKTLIDGKRGDCVEHFELTTTKEMSTGAGRKAGAEFTSEQATVLVAYVEGDVEFDYTMEPDRTLELRFHRDVSDPSQARPVPSPVNTLRNVTFEGDDRDLKVTFYFTDPVWPKIHEDTCRRRLNLYFPSGLTSIQAKNEWKRFMELPKLISMQLFDIGSNPEPYPEMAQGRDYHFFGYPSPLASNPYFENLFGFQQQGTLATFLLNPDVTYRLDEPGKEIYTVAFHRMPEPMYSCEELMPQLPDIDLPMPMAEPKCPYPQRGKPECKCAPGTSTMFPLQDEENRPFDF